MAVSSVGLSLPAAHAAHVPGTLSLAPVPPPEPDCLGRCLGHQAGRQVVRLNDFCAKVCIASGCVSKCFTFIFVSKCFNHGRVKTI